MNVLHVTTWYPNKKNPLEGLWIKRHIDALEDHCTNDVWHIRTEENTPFGLKRYKSHGAKHCVISLPTQKWFLIEIATAMQLLWFGIRHKKQIQVVDVINFHIAYPALTYWEWIKWLFPKPVIITEHWSAYHNNFGVNKELPRIKRIFGFNIPVITVSKALEKDIRSFSSYKFPQYVVHNIVDEKTFFFQEEVTMEDNPRFLMVSQWKYPKNPFEVIVAFSSFLKDCPWATLIIAGYGNQEEDIKELIRDQSLEDNIKYIGRLDGIQIAHELNKSTALIHISEYETFSVVCAEAICCGCPVIASDVGGIPEFITNENGVLVSDSDELLGAMKSVIGKDYNRREIAYKAQLSFSSEVVGKQYYNILQSICER